MTGSGRVWSPRGSTETRIEQLHEFTDELYQLMADVQSSLRDEASERELAIRRVQKQIAGLGRRIDAAEIKATQIDARGLPVVGAGILLSGIPEYIAELPLLRWGAPVAALALMVRAVVLSLRTAAQ